MITKKDIQESKRLVKIINKYVTDKMGDIIPESSTNELFKSSRLYTIGGPLEITIIEGNPNAIFTRFEFPHKAKMFLSCSPFSGKWNFHFNKGTSIKEMVKEFTFAIEPYLLVPNPDFKFSPK